MILGSAPIIGLDDSKKLSAKRRAVLEAQILSTCQVGIGMASPQEIDAINKRVDAIVDESVKFAEESPWPDDSEVLKDVYMDQNYPFIVD